MWVMRDAIVQNIKESIVVKEALLSDAFLIEKIEESVCLIISAFKQNKKVFFCGNGGSAADAQHLAAEFSGRFLIDRPPLFAEALHVNTSYLTAVANDYSFDVVYERLVEAFTNEGDVLVVLSTSGNSKNIVNAVKKAKQRGVATVALTGETGGKLKEICDILINIPSSQTPRIQESHITIGHIICDLVEKAIFG